MIKVLMISTDAKILEEGSSVRARMAEYATLFTELHIIVFSKKAAGAAAGASVTSAAKVPIAPNAFAYPTGSVSKLLYVKDALRIGQGVIHDAALTTMDSVITTQDPFETGIVGAKLSKKSGIGLHIQLHTDFHSPYFKGSILNRVRVALSRKVFPQAAAVRVVSERILRALSPETRVKAVVLPIFADVELITAAQVVPGGDLRAKYPQFGKIVLMASRLTEEKGFGVALEAFARVTALATVVDDSAKGAGLVIVGSGPEEAKIRSIAKALGITDRVVIEPWADHATVISYMKTCDAFLSASFYEGYGLSMLEAHAAGATLVATDAGIAEELAEEVAGVGDANDLAALLGKALEGKLARRPYTYPYASRSAYMDGYRKDIERAIE